MHFSFAPLMGKLQLGSEGGVVYLNNFIEETHCTIFLQSKLFAGVNISEFVQKSVNRNFKLD